MDNTIYVRSEHYANMKHERDEMLAGMPKGMQSMMGSNLQAVDLNRAFVPMEKDRKENLSDAEESVKDRFGLGEGGVM